METMTREEQIRNAADEHFAHSWRGSVKDAFVEGAQWADQYLKDNLVDIDKACDTIKHLLDGYVIRNFHFGDSYDMDELIDDFKKAMKGE